METRVSNQEDLEAIKDFRLHLTKELGKETIQNLNRENKTLDIIVPLLYLGYCFFGFFYLGTQEISIFWLFLFFLQGFALQSLGLILHDVFVHRRSWGKLNYFGRIIFSAPIFLSPSNYQLAHIYHHKKIGTLEDPEGYKQDLNTTWKRFLFLSMPGFMLTVNRFFSNDETKKWSEHTNFYEIAKKSKNPTLMRKVKLENNGLALFVATLLILAVFFPRQIFLGHLLPFFIGIPIAANLRIILEHAELNPNNPIHLATNYKTGPISQVLFFWDSGDCHLIHHLFPNIPFYNIPKAIRLINPYLLEAGVPSRSSLFLLIKDWYTSSYEHRSLWYK